MLGLALLPLLAAAQAVGENGYAAVRIDGANDVGQHMAFVRGPSPDTWRGFVHLADLGRLWYAECTPFGCNLTLDLTATGSGDRGRFVSAARRADGNAVAAWYDATAGDLKLTICTSSDCIFRTERTLDTTGDVGAGTSVAIDPVSGFPMVAYYDLTNRDLKLYRCTAADCASGVGSVVDAAGDVGRNPNLAIRSDGRPVLLYVRRFGADPVEFRLHVCADVDCTSGVDRLLDTVAATAILPQNAEHQLAIGPGDRAIALWSYSVSGVFSNRYARCNDAACSAVTVGTIGSTELYSLPLAVRSDGRPVFRESTAPTMQLGICATADCLPAGITRVALPIPLRTAQSMALRTGDAPVFDAPLAGGVGGIDACVDAACSASTFTSVIRDPTNPQSNFAGWVRTDPNGQPVAAWSEFDLGDVWLSVPLTEGGFRQRIRTLIQRRIHRRSLDSATGGRCGDSRAYPAHSNATD